MRVAEPGPAPGSDDPRESIASAGGMRGVVFLRWALVIAAVVVAQSVAHLALVLGANRIDTFVDLDRSNGLPDLVSTLVLAAATAGAVKLSLRQPAERPSLALLLAALLGALTVSDLLHDGAHPYRNTGPLVIGFVLCTVALLALLAVDAGGRVRATLAVGVCFLACSFLVIGLDRLDHWFERERGDPIAEYQIVVKEGLELFGWGLVALGLWDFALEGQAARNGAVRRTSGSAPRRSGDGRRVSRRSRLRT